MRPPSAPVVPPAARPSPADRALPPPAPLPSPRGTARSRRRAEAAEVRRYRPPAARRRRAAVLGLAGIAVLALAVPAALPFTPLLAVRSITVQGASASTAAAVRAALAGQVGRPLGTVDAAAAAAAVGAVPAVRAFRVVPQPPDALAVRVVERVGVVQVARGSGWGLADRDGVVIRAQADRFADVPWVVAGSRSALAAAGSAVAALDRVGGVVVRSVRAQGPDSVQLRLAGGRTVLWGGAEQGAAKAQALVAALRRAASGTSVVDVSSPGLVLTR